MSRGVKVSNGWRGWQGAFGTSLLALATVAGGCSGEVGGAGPDARLADVDGGPGQPDAGPTVALKRASRSSTIALSDDDKYVVLVNAASNSISIFDTTQFNKVDVTTGQEPSSVVIHPDLKTAFVANRADATVVRVSNIDTSAASVTATVDVGSEPTGLALSPTGRYLYVAEWAEGRVLEIDTGTMAATGRVIGTAQNPRVLTVTNNGDLNDDDELLVVPEFFGVPGLASAEGTDTSRSGRVRMYGLADLAPRTPIIFEPLDSGFVPDGSPGGTASVFTSPNQLNGIAIQGDRIYVTSVSASPAAPSKFNGNVFPVVYVGNLSDSTEDHSNIGTTNLATLVRAEVAAGSRLFLADISDIDFKGTSGGIAYVAARGADVLQRVVYDPATGITIGSAQNEQIDLGGNAADSSPGCQNPTGVVTGTGAVAYVNCWANGRLGVVDLSQQRLASTHLAGTVGDDDVRLGRRFFFTGRGRWSKEAWSSCGSCHPDGLSDNMTWVFGAGPRQTTSMDGSYSHGPGAQKQRVFNWTGIFDEIHDFERNTRGVQGGLGAITRAVAGAQCVKGGGALENEEQNPATAAFPAGLGQPMRELQDEPENCTNDWNKVEAFVKTIRPPRALTTIDAASVARGAALFGEPSGAANNGGCVKCHGGPGFTVSRRFWTPSSATNADLALAPFARPAAWIPSWNLHTSHIENQPAAADTTGATVVPAQVACVIRDVETFGVPGNSAATDALERRDTANAAQIRAQGAGGYNVPSLYGLAVGAPYLHHGGARTLRALFDDTAWAAHLTAGNQVFLVGEADADQKKDDLVNFLLSIDPALEAAADFNTRFGLPNGQDGCPASFP